MHSRLLTEHNGGFAVGLPREYVQQLDWHQGDKLFVFIDPEHPTRLQISGTMNHDQRRADWKRIGGPPREE